MENDKIVNTEQDNASGNNPSDAAGTVHKQNPFVYFVKNYLYLILCFASYFVLDVVFRYTYNDYNIQHIDSRIPLLFTLCWCVVLTAIIYFLPRIGKRIFMLVSIIFFDIVVIADCCLAQFFNRFFSFSMMGFVDDGAAAFDMSYISVRRKVIAVVILSIILMVAAFILAPKGKRIWARAIIAVVLITGAVFGISGIKSKYMPETQASWDQYKSMASTYNNFTDSLTCMNIAGIYQYTFRDTCLTFGIYDAFERLGNSNTVNELDEYYESKDTDPDNEMTGIFEGKNLILIQLEAVDTWMVNETAMPNLYRLQQEGINFENYYAPIYLAGPTFSTENIVNTGLVSPFIGISNTIYTKNWYPYSIAHLFANEDYSVNSFHTGAYMYDRKNVHANWGYEFFYNYIDLDFYVPLFDSKMLKGYDKMVSKGHNFYDFIITYSAHGTYAEGDGYDEYYDMFKEILPEDTEDVIVQAYAHTYETDRFIGQLVDRLENDGLLDDTVLIFYGDHYNKYVMDDNLIMKIKGKDNYYLIQDVPFIIYSKGIEARTESKYTSTIDVLPTIVNLFGLDTDGRYYIGNDMFSDNGGYVTFVDFSWVDETGYHAAGTAEAQTKLDEITERFEASWNTMKTNYFTTLD